jgi:hypothetical protein
MVVTFKILSTSYFEIHSYQPQLHYYTREHYTLFLLYNCDPVPIYHPFSIPSQPLVTTVSLSTSRSNFFVLPQMSENTWYLPSCASLFHFIAPSTTHSGMGSCVHIFPLDIGGFLNIGSEASYSSEVFRMKDLLA